VKRLAAGLAVVAWSGLARAQAAPPAPEKVSVGDWKIAPLAEVRVRGEYRRDLGAEDRGILVERVRLGVDAERGPIEMRVVLQDARLWDLGAGSDAFGQPGSLAQTGAYEGWIEAHSAAARPSFVRVGRQPITWGEGRLLGESDWSPTGRSLDAVRGRLVAGDWAFEAMGASLEDPVSPNGSPITPAYGELAGARVEWSFDPLFAVELYGLARFAQSQPALSLDGSVLGETYTPSLRLHGDSRGWTWGAEGAAQFGRAAAYAPSGSLDRFAYAFAGHVAYALERTVLAPSLRLGGSYATGDDGGTQYHAFDPMLPDAHRWYGAMDLFAWSNQLEGNARARIVPWTDAELALEYRYARLVQANGAWRSDYLVTIAPATAAKDLDLGHEIDLTFRWAPWVPLELTAGYSILILGNGAKEALTSEHLSTNAFAQMALGQARVVLP
jgi:hypothetical protein